MRSPDDVILDENKTIRMRDYKMEEIAEVEMPPHSKRPRLDFVEPGLDSSRFYDKTTSQEDKGINPDAGFQTCGNGIADFDPPKNGVVKTNMADAVSAGDLDLNSARNDVTDVSEDGKQQSPEMADPGNDSDSEISNISGGSEMAWRPMAAGPMAWVQEQMLSGKDPRVILRKIIPDPDIIPDHLEDFILWKIVASIVSEPPRRKKLKHINTVDDVVTLLKTSKKIMVLTGAGVSVSCGIPDFRSRNGIYARLAVDFPDLPDPQAMFDISYFRHDPRPFFKFAKEIYPGQFEPSRCHKFISLLDRKGKLLRNYTQNIDTLEQVAGIKNIIQCHGSFASATCMTCRYKVDAEAIRKDIFDQVIPHCPRCSPSSTEAVMKPDIVFFGESLPEEFHTQMAADKDVCDLLIVVGSSLKVRPVALIPNSLPAEIPQVLINREPLRHLNFDVELLGDCDVILGELCHRLGGEWSDLFTDYTRLEEVTKGELSTPTVSESDTGTLTSAREPIQPANSTSAQSCSTPEVNPALKDTEKSGLSEIKSESNVCPCDTKTVHFSDAKDNVSTIPSESVSSNMPDNSGGSHASTVHTKGDNSASTLQSPATDHDIENCESGVSAATLRDWWQSRHSSISSRLSSNQYLYVPPHRYVFNGAEVYSDSESEDGQFDDADEESSLSSFGAADNESAQNVFKTPDDSGQVEQSRHSESRCYEPHGEGIKDSSAVSEPPDLAAGDCEAAHVNGHPGDLHSKEKGASKDTTSDGSAVHAEGATSPVVQDVTDKCWTQNGATHSNVTKTQSNISPS